MTCILTTVPGNPKGIAALSPGLARQRLPWVSHKKQPNPEGVAPNRRGLFLARTAIEKSGGSIQVVDAPGGGACFRISP